jgi:hypothetical protein
MKSIPVKIKSVTFRSSIPTGTKFQHLHVEASADVPAGANPSAVLDGVKAFVARELVRARDGEKPKPVARPGRFQDELHGQFASRDQLFP